MEEWTSSGSGWLDLLKGLAPIALEFGKPVAGAIGDKLAQKIRGGEVGEHKIFHLTEAQIKKMKDAREAGKGIKLTVPAVITEKMKRVPIAVPVEVEKWLEFVKKSADGQPVEITFSHSEIAGAGRFTVDEDEKKS